MFICRREHVSVFGNRPKILHHLHRFIEGLIVRGGLAELFGSENLSVAGIAAKRLPAGPAGMEKYPVTLAYLLVASLANAGKKAKKFMLIATCPLVNAW